MAITDNSRAFGLVVQSAKGTAGTPTWLYYLVGWTWKPNLETRIPIYKTNTRHGEKRVTVTTRHDEVELELEFDSIQAAIAFTASLGTVTSTGPDTWKTGATTPKYCTLAWWEGESGEYWLMTDGQVAKIMLSMNLQGSWNLKITFWGPPAAKQTGAPSPTPTATADNSPFDPWQTVIAYGGASGVCLTDYELTIDNNLEAVYCTPATAPLTSTPPGLQPTRYAAGTVKVTGKLTLLYSGYASSGLQDYLEQTSAAVLVSATMPGYASAFTINVPKAQPISGTGLDVTKSPVYETVAFEGLYDSTAAAAAVITLTPPA